MHRSRDAAPLTPKKLAILTALAASGRTPVAKPEQFRDICGVDISPVLERVRLIPETEWEAENATKENNFSVFSQTHHIIARFSGGQEPESYYSTDFWSRWSDVLTPVIDAVTAHYGFVQPDVSKVMLARLAAGGKIDPHYDVGITNHLTHKIHVPIVTNDKVWFHVGTKRFQLSVGRAYELNNTKLHSVVNRGDAARTHLIFEIFDRAAR